MVKSKTAGQIYQLKITLRHMKPPVWRRVQVKDCTLGELHDVIQTCMSWYNCHLHEFEVGGERCGDPLQWQDGFGGEMEVGNEDKVKLSQVVAQGVKKFTYVYDMGDTWDHTIQVEKVLDAEAGVRYPRCIAGKRACPPEDCGGPWGYGNFLDAIQNPKHEQHEELLEWVGGEFDPEAFNIEAVNQKLR
jgi:Plasmid pRiA4b ORF-3-like protein